MVDGNLNFPIYGISGSDTKNLQTTALPYTHVNSKATRARAVRNVLRNAYLSSLTKNLWYEEREQLDSGGGGALSQGAGHDGSFLIA